MSAITIQTFHVQWSTMVSTVAFSDESSVATPRNPQKCREKTNSSKIEKNTWLGSFNKAYFVHRSDGGISGSGAKSRASMSLFLDSSYTVAYPPGQVTLPVGSTLYVGVSVEERDPDFVVVLEDCYASHSRNPNDPTQQSLIRNK